MLTNKKLYIVIFSGFFILLFYPLLVFESVNKYNPVNFLLYIISMVVVLCSILSIGKKNINNYNVFLLCYFFALFLNTLNVSSKQFLKTEEDLYFLLVGPFVVYLILFFFENLKVSVLKYKHINIINVDFFYIGLIFFYIFLKVYIGLNVGFKVSNFDDISIVESSLEYTIPGVSGVSAIAQWLLVILMPYVKKRYSILAGMSIIFFSGILGVKRGDIIRVFNFIFLYFIYQKIKFKQFNKRKIFNIIIGIIVFFVVFVQFGENRLEARGGYSGLIVSFLGSRVDSIYVAWVYSYFAFNFEIVRFYYNFPVIYEMAHVSEILFGQNLSRESLGLETSISGFNASTFLSPFILDYGYYYFVEIIIFSLVAGFFIFMSRKLNFLGLYFFMEMLMSLMVFGDYLCDRSMITSMVVAILIFPFLKIGNTNDFE